MGVIFGREAYFHIPAGELYMRAKMGCECHIIAGCEL